MDKLVLQMNASETIYLEIDSDKEKGQVLTLRSSTPLFVRAPRLSDPITFDIPEVDEVDQLGEISIPEILPEEAEEAPEEPHEDIRPHNQNLRCDNCADGKLILRKNRKTGHNFWGCSNYPKCKKTISASVIEKGT